MSLLPDDEVADGITPEELEVFRAHLGFSHKACSLVAWVLANDFLTLYDDDHIKLIHILRIIALDSHHAERIEELRQAAMTKLFSVLENSEEDVPLHMGGPIEVDRVPRVPGLSAARINRYVPTEVQTIRVHRNETTEQLATGLPPRVLTFAWDGPTADHWDE